jgi:hypothetical protein
MPYRLETLYLTEPDSCLLVASAISSLMKLKGMDPVSNVTFTSRQLDAWVVMMQSRYIVFLMQSRYIAATMSVIGTSYFRTFLALRDLDGLLKWRESFG